MKTVSPITHAANGLQDYIAISRYARYLPEKRRRETWSEAVGRVRDMHLSQYADVDLAGLAAQMVADGEVDGATLALAGGYSTLHEAIRMAFAAVDEKKVLPSMRSLQFGGNAVLKNHCRIYNCAFTMVDRLDAFREVFYLLLSGCGVGFSVQRQHVALLPTIGTFADEEKVPFVVPDTIEGWADAMNILVLAATHGRRVQFDFSQIRPAGAPLKTSGGKAPGPQPLFHALSHVEGILLGAAGRQLRPIEVYDCLMWAAKAVLSGGVRRSATICLFSPDDEEMANAKTGDWLTTNPQRSASNNSAVIVRSQVTREVFDRLFACQKQFGEPGFFFADDPDYGCNPCVEIGMNPKLVVDDDIARKLRAYGYQEPLENGQILTGVQFCNLVTQSAAAVDSDVTFYRLCAWAALIGTIQAGYTDFHYLSPISRVITEREALIGVSICGVLDRPDILLDPAVLRKGAAVVKTVNAVIARALGIQPAARTTCVKPEGTASLLLGTSSGLHPHHAVRYFRRVQANVYDPIFAHFQRSNPHMVEESVYDPHGRTQVITFPVEGPAFGIFREEVTALQHIEYIRLVQENWVRAGQAHERYSPGLHHNVSCTVNVKPDEWNDVADYIWNHRQVFTGLALLPDAGEKVYKQAPLQSVTSDEEIAQWNQLSYEPVDYTQLREEEDITDLKSIVACAGGACSLP